MDAVFVTLLIITVANLALAGLVLSHQIRAEVNRVFALTALLTAVWTLTNATFRIAGSVETAMLSAQLSYLAAILLGASIFHFSWTFPVQQVVPLKLRAILWVTALLIGLLSFIPDFVISEIDMYGIRSIETTSGVYVIALFLVTTIGAGFINFLRRHSSLRRVAREQSRYVLTGMGLTTVIGVVCNLFLPLFHNYSLVWLGPASSLIFVLFTVYAIVAHHLFDIRLIIKKTLVYSALLAAVGAGYSVAEHSLAQFLSQFIGNSDYAWLTNLMGALLVAIFFAPLKRWLESQISRIIYKGQWQHRTDR